MPTNRTRAAGLAALLTPVLLVVGQYLNVKVPADRGSVHGIGIALLTASVPAFVFGLWGLRARHGGLGRIGRAGIGLAIATPPVAFVLAALPLGYASWVAVFAGIGLLGLAVVMLCVEMLRQNVLPVLPLVLVAAGPIGVAGLIIAISAAGGDAGDVAAYPLLLTAVGFVWLGWFLFSETAVDGSRRRDPLATA